MAKDDPHGAAKALILFKDKYLILLRNSEDDIAPSQWDLPGGGIERGETIEETLIREVREETGLDISSTKILPIKTWTMDKGGIKIGGTDFLCFLDEFREIILSEEHVRAQWFNSKEVADSGEIPTWLKDDVNRADKLRMSEAKPQSNKPRSNEIWAVGRR